MVRLLGANRSFGDAGDLRCVRVPPSDQQPALSLLLTGSVQDGEVQVEQFIAFARQQHVSLEHLWAAYEGDKLIASALLVPSAGRTAMVFISPLHRHAWVAATTRLVGQLCTAQDPQKVALLQVLLDPGQERERQAVLGAGFRELTELAYMERPAHLTAAITPTNKLDLGAGIEIRHWSETNRKIFADAILASYEQTLDCPGLLGLRQIDDIIAGHMATGQFDPACWLALSHGEEPVGVMLLNAIPQRQALELVYLGLAPKWRGKGLGKKLVRHALDIAPRHGCNVVLLAVDQTNTPALKLYRSLGFVSTARKLAIIRTWK